MQGGGLVERDDELRTSDLALDALRGGAGWLHLVEGSAGIGKTALLDAGRGRAQAAGVRVLSARAGELESDFPYGVVRQLFEATVRSAGGARQPDLLTGAAAFAERAVLGPETPVASAADASFATLHGLYWLVANLCADTPLLLVVDDIHWCDPASLRFFSYLARRLDGLTAGLLVSVRTGEGSAGSEVVGELEASPGVHVSSLTALSDAGVAALLQGRLGQVPATEFTRASRMVTGGNPLLVHELASALITERIAPTAAEAGRIETIGPRTVARSTLARLSSLSAHAVTLAQAIAVLGADARLDRCSRLLELSEPEAATELDALVAADVVIAQTRLEFRHPIVRTAIYELLAPGERSALHRRIAGLLEADGAELDAVAGHLLRSQPTGSPAAIATLRAAARHAVMVGASDSAAIYLERALEEGGGRALRIELLLELARAEALAGRPTALAHLEEVRGTADDPHLRALAAIDLAWLLVYTGGWDQPIALLDAAIAELGASDPALNRRAEAARVTIMGFDPRLVDRLTPRLPALRRLALEDTTWSPPTRPLALSLAGIDCARGEPHEQICKLVERGWDDGRYLSDGLQSEQLAQGIMALLVIDELDRAGELVEAVRSSAGARGSAVEFLIASSNAVWLHTRAGQLAAAEAELRSGCERALEHGLMFALPTLLWLGTEVMIERPDTADLAALAETMELGPMGEVMSGSFARWARGRLRFAAGRGEAAIADLRHVGAMCDALAFVNPNLLAWRSELALMLTPDERKEALALIQAELVHARRIGQPRGIGVALSALGKLTGGEPGVAHLTRAVQVLGDSPARLEYASALIDLGAALRRSGSRAAARDPLHRGLDLATRCGALRLAQRAGVELSASGGRRRRTQTSGPAALTPSELRVAQMAASGESSQAIAQTLFVTRKTIDMHLQRAYGKLGINSRRQLPAALERPSANPPTAGRRPGRASPPP